LVDSAVEIIGCDLARKKPALVISKSTLLRVFAQLVVIPEQKSG